MRVAQSPSLAMPVRFKPRGAFERYPRHSPRVRLCASLGMARFCMAGNCISPFRPPFGCRPFTQQLRSRTLIATARDRVSETTWESSLAQTPPLRVASPKIKYKCSHLPLPDITRGEFSTRLTSSNDDLARFSKHGRHTKPQYQLTVWQEIPRTRHF
jgi:hypothetical protein